LEVAGEERAPAGEADAECRPRWWPYLAAALTAASAVYLVGGFWVIVTSICGP
jgi:hypothetical protein